MAEMTRERLQRLKELHARNTKLYLANDEGWTAFCAMEMHDMIDALEDAWNKLEDMQVNLERSGDLGD